MSNGEQTSESPHDGVVHTFSLSNPASGPGYWDVSRLLRRLAEELDQRRDARVLDITFHNEYNGEFDDMHFTVYYYIADQAEKDIDSQLGLA